MPQDLTQVSASELIAAYRSKALSPVEVAAATLKRIAELQPHFNAYRAVDAEAALAQAKASEARWAKGAPLGLLDGVPVGFKDLLNVKGFPTRKGSLATPDTVQQADSPPAARLRDSGAVILGKTQTAEFGLKGLTETKLAGVTPNAWDRQYVSGGSSGGAGVAAALGLGPLQVATDGGGSIRNPAAINGVFGFKPTFGRVAGYPHNGSLFHIGPITRTVTDAALLLNVIAQPDARDWTSLPSDGRDWTAGLDGGVKGLRVAYSRTLGYIQVDPGVAAVVDRAVARLAELGVIVEEADPGFSDPSAIIDAINAERAIRLRRDIGDAGLDLIDPGIRKRVERLERQTLAEVVEANERRTELGIQLRRFHEKYDLLVTPVQSKPVPRVGTAPETPFAFPFNITQQPAASAPAGFDNNGLPVGLHIVGPQFGDATVLRLARAFEKLQPFPTPHLESLGRL
ncbi:amidase [Methylosinus sp. H3A]|uniref:amidase n=1 Tax=Methylosinus sp. H3A TaxID=2785786 RepID=UPI0018C21BEE|nr:amidase [Methylosinus sp. H3A]MBG0808259.1 amidase [Methylosinus sp. H3A]